MCVCVGACVCVCVWARVSSRDARGSRVRIPGI